MTEYSVFIFRHGQTSFNRDGRFTGLLNPRLTKRGVLQARIVAKKLKNKKFSVAFSSSLSRSRKTLSEVLKFHPECRKIIVDDRIIERNYGDLNGLSHRVFISNIGKRLYNLEVEGDLVHDLSSVDKKKVITFLGEQEYNLIHRGYNNPPPGGESFRDVEVRVRSFINYLKDFVRKNKCNVAISAHGNSIRLFRKIMEGASSNEATSWVIPYDDYFEYKLKG